MNDAEALGWYRTGREDGRIGATDKLIKLRRWGEGGEFVRWADIEELVQQLRYPA